MEELTPEQALQNLDNAVSTIQANRQTHLLLQQSVSVIAIALAQRPLPADAEKPTV